jgi:hypothetical protein
MMRKSDLDCRILKFSKSDSRDLSSNQGKISKLNLFKNRKIGIWFKVLKCNQSLLFQTKKIFKFKQRLSPFLKTSIWNFLNQGILLKGFEFKTRL